MPGQRMLQDEKLKQNFKNHEETKAGKQEGFKESSAR